MKVDICQLFFSHFGSSTPLLIKDKPTCNLCSILKEESYKSLLGYNVAEFCKSFFFHKFVLLIFPAAIEDEKKPDLGGDHDNEGASQINQVRTIDGDVEEKEEPDGAREHNDQMDEKGELSSTSNNSTNGAKVTNSEPPVYLVD